MKKYIIKNTSTLMEAIKCINDNAEKIALAVDRNERLVGIITDGDIRRALINGLEFNDSVSQCMSSNPLYIEENNKLNIQRFMIDKGIKHLPIVNSERKIVRIEFLDNLLEKNKKDNWVFLFAGGLGERLQPLTNDIPKPLIKVGNKPILEDIISCLKKEGFNKFFISVNYKSEMIEQYFGDGRDFDCEIEYIHEETPLGTAGSLSLIKKINTKFLLLINGDILTNLDFEKMFLNIKESNLSMIAASKEYKVDIPYAIFEESNKKVSSFKEKPSYLYYSNAGIYILKSKLVKKIPYNTFYNITDLMENIANDKKLNHFPIRGYWIDIGSPNDYSRAKEFLKYKD